MCIFFLLSAYLITELLIRERTSTGGIHLGAFYTRRILRIWPLYFGAVFAGYFVGLLLPQFHLSRAWVAAFVFLAGNWYTGMVSYAPGTVAALWSISLEEQFYLLWPSIAKFGGIRALTGFAILTIPVGYAVLFYLCGKGVRMQPSLWTNSFIQFSFFGIGALIALALHTRSFSVPMPLRVLLFGSGVLLWLVSNRYFHVNGVFYEARPWLVSCGFGLVTVACTFIFFSLFGISRALLPPQLIYLRENLLWLVRISSAVPRAGSMAARWDKAWSVVSTAAADGVDNPSGFAFVSIFREAFLASKSPFRVHQNAIGLQAHPAEFTSSFTALDFADFFFRFTPVSLSSISEYVNRALGAEYHASDLWPR